MRRLLLSWCALMIGVSVWAREHVALIGTYTGNGSRGIYVVRLDGDTGALSAPELVAELAHPEFLALHPNGRFVYALTQVETAEGKRSGAVAAFSVDTDTGRLTPLNVEPTGRGSLCHLAVDRTGRMLVVASYGDAYTASFPISEDGRVGARQTMIAHEGPLGPNRERQDAAHAHSVTISPDNRVAFVADLGLDRVIAYRLDADHGTIAPHEPAFTSIEPGAGPRHTAFSPDGRHFYVLDELDCTVTSCRYDPDRSVLEPFERVSTLPDDFKGKNTTSEIRIHPSGRFVYAANRGHESLAVFARDAATGSLKRVEVVPAGGDQPRNFALTTDGEWLLCGHQQTNTLAIFRVDTSTGRLTRVGDTVAAIKPVCVLFLR
jgi:6-phosphogluconolactonase